MKRAGLGRLILGVQVRRVIGKRDYMRLHNARRKLHVRARLNIYVDDTVVNSNDINL